MAVKWKEPLPLEEETEEIFYPDSDGMGMPDGDPQREVMWDVEKILARRYAGDPQVYVSANIFVYYVEGDPSQVFSPDVMVVKGAPKRRRDTYKFWEEGDRPPDFILEIAARKTYRQDLRRKKGLYRLLGVREYLLFDHTGGEYFRPPLQGYRLEGGRYVSITAAEQVHSQVLGVTFRWEHGQLNLYDSASGARLLPPEEARQAAEQARQIAEQARQAAEQARQAAEQARQAAEQARQATEQARQAAEVRAAREVEARREAEAELARLRTELARLRGEEMDPDPL